MSDKHGVTLSHEPEPMDFKSIVVQLKSTYTINWLLDKNNAIDYTVFGSLETKDIFLENNIQYVFGKFNALKNTSRLGAIDATVQNEFYGFIAVGYKYVAHNALIHGSLFKDEILFTTPIENHIFKLEIGSILKVKKNTFTVRYNFNTKETPLASSHVYGTFGYARSF